MATKSPVFPIPHHFSDYGFDPQFDYFQLLEEAKRHNKRESSSSFSARSIETLHFKLQKPISRDLSSMKKKSAAAGKKRRWWKNALFFFKSKWARSKPAMASIGPSSISGPLYITESLSGSSTPFRSAASPSAAGNPTQLDIPYVSLRDFNMDQPYRISAPSPMPIYLVT